MSGCPILRKHLAKGGMYIFRLVLKSLSPKTAKAAPTTSSTPIRNNPASASATRE